MSYGLKRCKKCGVEKPAGHFWYNPKTKDKLKTACISCCKEYDKEYYLRNREERIKQIKKWQAEQKTQNQ